MNNTEMESITKFRLDNKEHKTLCISLLLLKDNWTE